MLRTALASLALLAAVSAQAVELSVVTTKGYVALAVPDDWRVLSTQTRPPISAMAFQIFNAADEGTQHSTNVAVSFFHVDFDRGRQAAEAPVRAYGEREPTVEAVGGWTTYSQEATQGGVKYVIVDARRPFADVVAAVRIAWPKLAGNPPDYDVRMRSAFDTLLRSVSGGLGPLPQKEGQVIRRPVQ